VAIASISDYQASLREVPFLQKSLTRAPGSIILNWISLWDQPGAPGAGTLAVGNTANGAVPTDATVGAPTVNFGAGAGYITSIDWAGGGLPTGLTLVNDHPTRWMLYDRLFHAGAYAFNAAVTLASQPSYAARVPGSSYSGLLLLYETVTAFTGTQQLAVTYTNEAGTAGRTTGTQTIGTPSLIGQMFQLPLQAGDTGIQKIESVTSTTASAGTFNIIVARPLAMWASWNSLNEYGRVPMDVAGMTPIFGDSCLTLMHQISIAGVQSQIDVRAEIASK